MRLVLNYRGDEGWRILDYQEKALDSERNWIPRRDLNPGTLRAVVTGELKTTLPAPPIEKNRKKL